MDFTIPTTSELNQILRDHPLIRLRERVKKSFLVGSFAKEFLGCGATHSQSDVDILLEIAPNPRKKGMRIEEIEDSYRQKLRQYFVTHDLRGVHDEVHPQWCGRRIDVYMTFDASTESRPKMLLSDVPEDRDQERERPRG